MEGRNKKCIPIRLLGSGSGSHLVPEGEESFQVPELTINSFRSETLHFRLAGQFNQLFDLLYSDNRKFSN